MNDIKKDPGVDFAEPNYIYQIFSQPNDAYFDLQWQFNQSSDCDIDAPEAWNINTGSSETIVAIVDTGIDWDHVDLANNIWNNTDEYDNSTDDDSNGYNGDIRGWDFYYNDSNPNDDHGHGTHCAGIIGAVGNNGIGISGICQNCSLMPIKALNYNGEGYASDLADAIYYAADNGADVISMSWGGYFESSLIEAAINYAYEKDIVLIAAAGNSNLDRKVYPAGYDNVISVAATNKSDHKSIFSNWGSWVDVSAPGSNIFSTYRNDGYTNLSGTSFSCPHVAGLAGLIRSNNSSLSNIEIKNILQSSSEEVFSNYYIGVGRINAYNALSYEKSPLAIINSSVSENELTGNISIYGTANGTYFTNYTLYYGSGVYPSSWNELDSSNFTINDGKITNWNTSQLSDGLYSLKLVVNSSLNIIGKDIATVKVNNNIETLRVGGDGSNNYSSISEGVLDAGNGDSVFVYSGIYNESIMISNNIDLMGENKSTTIIDQNYSMNLSYAVWVNSDQCNISNFTIRDCILGCVFTSNNNSKIENNVFNNTMVGIYILSNTTSYNIYPPGLVGSSIGNTTVSNNIIHNSLFSGIFCIGDNIFIENNTMDCQNFSVIVGLLSWGNNNTIINNSIDNQYISSLITYSNNNIIYNNNFSNAFIAGLGIIYSDNNKIYGNQIGNSNFSGLLLSGSNNNTIYYNKFLNNNYSVSDDGDNYWYSSTYCIGNYYDNYSGLDTNNDGLGDTPYSISDGNNLDLYPIFNEPTVPPTFVWVDDDYNGSAPGWHVDHFYNIQAAVDNVTSGGGIYFYNGTYYENIDISKKLTLTGSGFNNCIVNSTKNDHIINVNSDWVNVSGITAENGSNEKAGFYLNVVENVSINLVKSHSNDYGFRMTSCNNICISNSIICENSYDGLYITNSNNNTICKNRVYNNTLIGIRVLDSSNNTIYHNNFYNNSNDNCNDDSISNNTWYNTTISEGNYWGDYTTEYPNASYSNGIYDTPYNITGGVNNDTYPLVSQFENYLILKIIDAPPSITEGRDFTVTVKTLGNTYVENALVSIQEDSDTTNSNGQATLTAPSVSSDTSKIITASKTGYTSNTTSINVNNQQSSSPSGSSPPPSIPTNNPPTANAGGSYSGMINSEITFDGSSSSDPDEDTLTYSWNFGDGNTGTGDSTKHSYASAGTYTATLTVSDGSSSNSDTANVTIKVPGSLNPPVSNADGPYNGLTYEKIIFDGSKSYDNGTIVNYTWDFGDGTKDYNKKTSHIYNTNGKFTVKLIVTDDEDYSSTDTTIATIKLDTDADGWSDEEEKKYGYNYTNSSNCPIDTDGNRIPDDHDDDDDGDGLDDMIEDAVGSNKTDKNDVKKINSSYYLIDADLDGIFEKLYYKNKGVVTHTKILDDGSYLLDMDNDEKWDHVYTPSENKVDSYEEEKEDAYNIPWIPLIAIIAIIIVVLVILILYKIGYIWIEEYEE